MQKRGESCESEDLQNLRSFPSVMVPLLFACLSAWVGQPYGLVDLVLVRLATALLSIPLFPLVPLIPLIPSSLVFSLMKLGIPFAMGT